MVHPGVQEVRESSAAAGTLLSVPNRHRRLNRRQYIGYLFVLPAVGLLAVFQLWPIVSGILLSLEKWDGLSPSRTFVGLANYASVLTDPTFWISIRNSVVFGAAMVVIGGGAGLGLAIVVHSRPTLSGLFRAIFFLPYMLSPVVFGYLWLWILDPSIGPLNTVLSRIVGHTVSVAWLGSPTLAFWSIAAVFVWCHWGFGFLIFLSGLQGVPQDYLDAAALDGATSLQRFRHIVWPLLIPITLVVTVVSLLLAMQIFATTLIMTNGGPGYATEVPTLLIYQEAFVYYRVGRSAAISIVFGLFMLLMSGAQLLVGRKFRV